MELAREVVVGHVERSLVGPSLVTKRKPRGFPLNSLDRLSVLLLRLSRPLIFFGEIDPLVGLVDVDDFGFDFERMLMFVTGVSNIRDVIPFARTPGSAEF